MSEKKAGLGEKVIGWFVEREEAPAKRPSREPEARVPEAPPDEKPTVPPRAPLELKGDLPLPADAAAELNFAAVFRAAGVSDEAQDRVEKALALLASLPAETPRDVKRQIVEASLKAFGVAVEGIVEAGASELQALDTFVAFGERNTQKAVAEANARIEALSQEIAAVKGSIEQKLAAQQKLADGCSARRLRIEEVLEFFGASGGAT